MWAKIESNLYYLPALLAGFAGAALLLGMGHTASDDAYITFVHARNLAESGVLAYNVEGIREMGSTTPFFAALLGVLGFVFGANQIHSVSLYLNAVLIAFNAVLLFRISLQLTENYVLSVAIALLLSVNSFSIRILSHGFESGLFISVFFLAIHLLIAERYSLAVFLAGLAPLVRPEGVLLSAIVWPVLFWRRSARPKHFALYAIAPIAWIGFALPYYGSVIPQSVMAKFRLQGLHSVVGPRGSLWERFVFGFDFLGGVWDVMLKPVLLFNSEPGIIYLYGLRPGDLGNFFLRRGDQIFYAMILCLGATALVLYRKRRPALLAYFAYFPFFFLFLAYSKALAAWYIPIWSQSSLLLLSVGFYTMARPLAKYIRHAGVTVLGLVVVGLLLGKNTYLKNDHKHEWQGDLGWLYAPAYWDDKEYYRYHGYRKAALFLNARGPGSVAMGEAGVFSYFYKNGSVIDLLGLCSSEPVRIYLKNRRVDGVAVIKEMKPRYLVATDPGSADYRKIYEDRANNVFGQPLQIFERVAN